MPKAGNVSGHANVDQRGVESNLPRRRRQQVLSEQHVGDPHQGIIHGVHKRVQRLSASSHQHKVCGGGRREENFAPDEVLEASVQLGNPQAQGWLAPFVTEGLTLLGGEVTLVVVIPLLGVAPQRFVSSGHFFVRHEALVEVAGFQ